MNKIVPVNDFESMKDAPKEYSDIIRLTLADLTADEVAKELGMSPRNVKMILAQNICRNELGRLHMINPTNIDALMPMMDRMMRLSLQNVESILRDKSYEPELKLKAAEFIADRHPSGLLAKQSKQDIKHQQGGQFDSEFIERLKKQAQSIQVSAQDVERLPIQEAETVEDTADGTDNI